MALAAERPRSSFRLRFLGASAGAAFYVVIALMFHPAPDAEITALGLIHSTLAWLLALLLAGFLLGPMGGAAFGLVLGLAQWPIEWLASDTHPIDVGFLVISAIVGIAAGALSGAFADMHRKGKQRAVQIEQQHIELKRTTDRLERSDILFRQFADRVDVGIWIAPVSPPGRVFMNPAVGRIYGVEGNVTDWRQNIHADDKERVLASAGLLGSQDEVELEYRLVLHGGPTRWVRARSFVVRDLEGKVAVMSGLLEDITEEKLREERRETVERRERLAALGTLVAGVAHEINNPLTYMVGNMRLAQDAIKKGTPEATERAGRLLQTSVDGGGRIANIVRALRSVARTGIEAERGPVDLNAVASNVHALMVTSVPPGVELRLEKSREPAFVVGNAGELAQIVLNLATNAVQALGERPGRVVVEVKSTPSGPHLVVRDTGPGIPEDVRARLFTPFFTTKVEGTGLGLSIVHAIVQEHNGEIEVDSSPGKGAVFRVTFPPPSRPLVVRPVSP